MGQYDKILFDRLVMYKGHHAKQNRLSFSKLKAVQNIEGVFKMKKSFYQRALAWVLTAGMLTMTLPTSFAAEKQVSASDPIQTIETYVPEEGQNRISTLSSALESSEIATATLSSTTCPGCSTGHNGWTEITSGGTYTGSGNYYLSDNVKGDLIFTGNGQNSTTINFCLNDKTLTGSGTSSVVLLENLSFNLYGGSGDLGVITGGGGESLAGGIYGTAIDFQMYGGNIQGNTVTSSGGGL